MRTIAMSGAAVIRGLGRTWRISVVDDHLLQLARECSPRLIFVFWHGRLLPMAYTHRQESVHILASEHSDGEMLGQVIRRLGFGHVRGSSTRGGARAIRGMVRKIEEGFDVGLTVDGPRGPRYVVKPGPVEIARQSGAVIMPVTSGSTRHKTFASWDAFELPVPFSRVQVRYGAHIHVPADADEDLMEKKRLDVERALRDITDACDRSVAT